MGLRVLGLEARVQGTRRVQGLGVSGSGFGDQVWGFEVQGPGVRVWG